MNEPEYNDAIKSSARLWQEGQEVIEAALEQVEAGVSPSHATYLQLNRIHTELRKQIRRFEHLISDLDAQTWEPWVIGKDRTIAGHWELEELCRYHLEHKRPVNWKEFAEAADDRTEWFNSLAKQYSRRTFEQIFDLAKQCQLYEKKMFRRFAFQFAFTLSKPELLGLVRREQCLADYKARFPEDTPVDNQMFRASRAKGNAEEWASKFLNANASEIDEFLSRVN